VERRKRGFHCRKQLLFALEAAGRPPMRLQIGNDLLLPHDQGFLFGNALPSRAGIVPRNPRF
jgi:hypothetical protein